MADLIDQQGMGENDYTRVNEPTTQYAVFGGGGTYRPFQQPDSPQTVSEPIQHMAVIPIMMPRNDSAVPDHFSSDNSIGVPNQPVYGGDPAPFGLSMDGQYDPRFGSGRSFTLPYVAAPSSSLITDPLGQIQFWGG